MKKIALCFLFLISSIALSAQITKEQAEQSIINGIKYIRVGMQYYLPQNKPFEFQTYTDTLYRYLYVDSIKIKVSTEMLSKITLQSFFAETQDERVNYPDIRKTLMITHKFDAFHDPFFISCAVALGEHYENKNKGEYAIEAYGWAMKALSKVSGNMPNFMGWQLNKKLSRVYFVLLRQYKKALNYQIEALKILEQLEGTSPDYYFKELLDLGISYNISGLSQQADSCYTLYQPYLEKNPDITDEERMDFYENRGNASEELKNNLQAISYFKKAYEYADNDSSRVTNLIHIGQIQFAEGDYDSLKNTLDHALQIAEQDNTPKAEQLIQLFVLCNISNTGSHQAKIIQLFSKSDKKETLSYKAYFCWADKKYEASRKLINQAMAEIDKKIMNDTAFLQGKEVQDLAIVLTKMSDWKNAIRYQSMILNDLIKTYGRLHPLCISTMSLLTGLYMLDGDYQTAEEIIQKALKTAPVNSPNLTSLLETEANCQSLKGNFLKAAKSYEKLLDYLPNIKDRWNAYFDITGCLISEYDLRKNNRDNRLPLKNVDSLLINAIENLRQLTTEYFNPTAQEAFLTTNYQASYEALKEDYVKMRVYAAEAEKIVKKHITNPELKRNYLESLAFLYIMSHDYQKALSLIDFSIPESNLLPYVDYMLRAEAWLGLGNKKKAQKYYIQQANDIISRVCHEFAYMTEKERSHYWNIFKQTMYDAGKYTATFDKQSPFAGTLYDIALFSKGLLLRSSTALSQAIEESGDSVLKQQHYALLQTRMEQNKNPHSKDRTGTDRIERELIQKSTLFSNYMKDIKSDWRSLQKQMGSNDLAIEFITYYTPDSIGHYAAVILRSSYKYPILVEVAEKENLEMQLKDLAINKANSDKVWKPFIPYLKGIKNIYFSPSGILHKLAIEYMPFEDTEFIFDRYNIHRLSSTKELMRRTPNAMLKKAIVYGGLEYDADITTLTNEINKDEKAKIAYRSGITRSVSERAGVNYLKGTLAEAESIERMLTDSGINTELLTEFNGTEESLKRRSGEDINLIHIATHGFCEVGNSISRTFMSSHINPNQDIEDQTMLQSGILFSGANNILNGIPIPAYLEDGILTAKELSLLDLHNASLVVLSACVTADGDITGDGVFGVQRGLKQAGVRSIMMSSWNVSDIATELLMNRFYKNLTTGKSKRESLLEAIRYVKHYRYEGPEISGNMPAEEQEKIKILQKGFDDYKYWAPFILLDGLN